MQKQKIYRPELSTARDARAVRTRAALRRALLDLLDSRPIERISIRDIATAAGIGYTTFFRHHPNRESLLNELAAEELERLVGLTAPMVRGRSARAAADAFLRYVDERRALWCTLLTGGAAPLLREQFLRIATGVADRRRKRGWPPADIATRLVVGGTIEVVQWWLRQSRPAPIAEVAEILDRMVIMPALSGRKRGTRTQTPRRVARPQRDKRG